MLEDLETMSDEGVPQYSPKPVSPIRTPAHEKQPGARAMPEQARAPFAHVGGRVDQWRQSVTSIDQQAYRSQEPSRASSIRSYSSSSASGSQRAYESTRRAPLSEMEEAQRQFQLAQQQLLLAAQRLALAGSGGGPTSGSPSPLLDVSSPPLGTSPGSDREYMTPVESLPSPLDSPAPTPPERERFESSLSPADDYLTSNDLHHRDWRRSPLSMQTSPHSYSPSPPMVPRRHPPNPASTGLSSPLASSSMAHQSSAPFEESSSKQRLRAEDLAAAAQDIERAETAPPPSYTALAPVQSESLLSPSTSHAAQDPFARRFQAPIASPTEFDPYRSLSPVQSEVSVQEFHGFRPRVNSTSSQQALNMMSPRPVTTQATTYSASYGRGAVPTSRFVHQPNVVTNAHSMSMAASAPVLTPVVPYARPAQMQAAQPRMTISTAMSPSVNAAPSPMLPTVIPQWQQQPVMRRSPSASNLLEQLPPRPQDSVMPMSSSPAQPHPQPSTSPTPSTATSTGMLRSRVKTLRERVMSPHVRFKSPSPEDDEARSLVERRIEEKRGTTSLANVERSLSMLL